MDRWRRHRIAAAFLAAFVAVGLPYWRIPYRSASLPDSLIAPGLLAVGLAALLLRASGGGLLDSAIAAGAAVPAAVLARVAVEVAKDPTSHNLWPFEAVIALAVAAPCALAGALVGSAAVWWMRRSSAARGGPR